jgi:hypothetical protein
MATLLMSDSAEDVRLKKSKLKNNDAIRVIRIVTVFTLHHLSEIETLLEGAARDFIALLSSTPTPTGRAYNE